MKRFQGLRIRLALILLGVGLGLAARAMVDQATPSRPIFEQIPDDFRADNPPEQLLESLADDAVSW